jgi:Tfp pilus assembly protein PilO
VTPRDRTVVVVLAVAAVLAAVWFGVVSPRRAELGQLRQQDAQARTQRDTAVTQAAAGLAAKKTYATNLTALAKLGKAVPATDDTASLLYQLQDAAGHAKVTLTAVTPGGTTPGATPAAVAPVTPAPATAAPTTGAAAPAATAAAAAPGAQTIPISFTFQGSYADLQSFLRRIESFATLRHEAIAVRGRLVVVNSIALTLQPGAAQVSAVISASTYTAAAPSPATAIGSPVTPAPSTGSATPPTASAAVLGAGG